jgi:hypothetical protein
MKFTRREVVCLILSLLVLEWLLYVCEHHLRFRHFDLLRKSWYEFQYFAHQKTPPPKEPPVDFHPRLGWWKPRNVFPPFPVSNRKRVLVFGDSFMNGLNLEENETAPYFLQKELGKGYEVVNLAVSAYGLDQMALAVRDYGVPLHPDFIVVGFIAADLSRSCYDFIYNTKKPSLRHAAQVETPYETWSRHQSVGAKIRDRFASLLLRSRTVCLLGEVALTPGYRDCLSSTNEAWIKKLRRWTPGHTRVLLVHLDSPVPPSIELAAARNGIDYVSLAKLDGERFHDRHPKGSLNRRYAESIANALHGVERSLSTISIAPSPAKFY